MRFLAPLLGLGLGLSLSLSAVAPADAKTPLQYERAFEAWLRTHHLTIADALEYARRLERYIENDRLITTHNAQASDHGYTLAHNAFSHLSWEEFKHQFVGGFDMPPSYLTQRKRHANLQDVREEEGGDDVPDAVDWVAKGAVTPVKNQGMCGSCWAFSTTGAVEGAAFVASGQLISLSEQQLVDCDDNGDMGCQGGLMDHAFEWIEHNGGLCTEESYQYHANQSLCQESCRTVVRVTGYTDVASGDEKALQAAVAKQPVSVAIEADQRDFQFYHSGVFSKKCGTNLDHGVLVVGYGTEDGNKYWKVKNSWGATWGENGFIRLARELGPSEGQCGIAMVPSYPVAHMKSAGEVPEMQNFQKVAVQGMKIKSPLDYEREFAAWMKKHGLTFANALEYARRLANYISNDILIMTHNAEKKWGFTLAHNEYSHLSFDEFHQQFTTGFDMPPGFVRRPADKKSTLKNAQVPDDIDWVDKGAVTPVKNQGMCGSCWAFSTTGAVEGALFVSSGKLVSLSEQQLVDCDNKDDKGCNGGFMENAFKWIEHHGGLCAEDSYTYHEKQEHCNNTCKPVVTLSGFQEVEASDEKALQEAVAQQPVSVAIEADQREFQFYHSGVFDKKCGTQLDHGVLVVGYGEEDGHKFWKVKNSWGPTWGEQGFIRLAREFGPPEGQCGIAMVPSYPLAHEKKMKELEMREEVTDVKEANKLAVQLSKVKSSVAYEREFAAWLKKHGLTFSNPLEYARRLENYIANDLLIMKHNAEKKWGFTLAHNQYSHLSWEEFHQRFTAGFEMPAGYVRPQYPKMTAAQLKAAQVPDAMDWVDKGAVTPVKNQGMCGSCWAFSTTGAVEGSLFVSSGKLISLSEQQLVDCDNKGDHGCHGGFMENAYKWIEHHGGLCSEDSYSYHAKKQHCNATCKSVVTLSGFQEVRSADEKALQEAVAQQPIAVAIEADQREFQFYHSGVFDKPCGTQLDHGVLVVGYGEDNGHKFWKVKNSWGATWGENGFIRISREAGDARGQCGVALAPSYPFAHLKPANELQVINRPDPVLKPLRSSAKIAQCGDPAKSGIVFESLSIQPTSPKRGKPVVFVGTGKFKEGFDKAEFDIVVRLAGEHIFGQTGQLCGQTHLPLPLGLGHIDVHGFPCPMTVDQAAQMQVDVNLPIIAPMGNYEIQVIAHLPNVQEQLFCVHVDLELDFDAAQQKPRVYEFLAVM